MGLFYITLVFVLQNTLGENSNVKEGVTSFEDFPQTEYPKTVLDAVPFNLQPSGILDYFPGDVKTSFKEIENQRNGKKATAATLIDILAPVSNKDGSITDIHNFNVEFAAFEENTDEGHSVEYFNIEGADKLPIIISPQSSQESNETQRESSPEKKYSKKNNIFESFNVEESYLSNVTSTEDRLLQNEAYLNNDAENQESNIKKDNQEIITDYLQTKHENIYANRTNETRNDVSNLVNSNTDTDTHTQTDGSFNDTDLKREKRSPNMSSDSTSIENLFYEEYISEEVENSKSENCAKTTTVQTSTSSEAVLPRPPLATDGDDGIIIEDHDGPNED